MSRQCEHSLPSITVLALGHFAAGKLSGVAPCNGVVVRAAVLSDIGGVGGAPGLGVEGTSLTTGNAIVEEEL